ncbi:hypothetical protein SeMB42_g06629 [Synchytrium endobioticum]|uniref:CUE domain-containing protein n=1 Tax=Synchytrium endobioticum TaxID=286115 RepID=A0A507CG57_9FUNG|nr:hypothetical protein SeMB42_g06629 [Synchytrium endobioticum]TPX45507.1 hypothetical protein SeLEV6574_g03831 [Synchytrium endobioticum]TPX45510.1 hypothetical protein SeLEV6574_g03836 [Synchytrium endobioticum]
MDFTLNPWSDEESPPPQYQPPPSYTPVAISDSRLNDSLQPQPQPQPPPPPPPLPPRRVSAESTPPNPLLNEFPDADAAYLQTILVRFNRDARAARAYLKGQGLVSTVALRLAKTSSHTVLPVATRDCSHGDSPSSDKHPELPARIANAHVNAPTDAEIEMLGTVFPDCDDDLLMSVLQTFRGDMARSIAYLEEKGFEASDAAKTAMLDDNISPDAADASKEGRRMLVERFPTVDEEIIQGILESLGSVERASEYIYQKVVR